MGLGSVVVRETSVHFCFYFLSPCISFFLSFHSFLFPFSLSLSLLYLFPFPFPFSPLTSLFLSLSFSLFLSFPFPFSFSLFLCIFFFFLFSAHFFFYLNLTSNCLISAYKCRFLLSIFCFHMGRFCSISLESGVWSQELGVWAISGAATTTIPYIRKKYRETFFLYKYLHVSFSCIYIHTHT